MKYVLVLIAWNGTLATALTFDTREQCESAGAAWIIEAKNVVATPRYVCFSAASKGTINATGLP